LCKETWRKESTPRLRGLVRRLRRYGGGPEVNVKINGNGRIKNLKSLWERLQSRTFDFAAISCKKLAAEAAPAG
jgi:hypothetical protein